MTLDSAAAYWFIFQTLRLGFNAKLNALYGSTMCRTKGCDSVLFLYDSRSQYNLIVRYRSVCPCEGAAVASGAMVNAVRHTVTDRESRAAVAFFIPSF